MNIIMMSAPIAAPRVRVTGIPSELEPNQVKVNQEASSIPQPMLPLIRCHGVSCQPECRTLPRILAT